MGQIVKKFAGYLVVFLVGFFVVPGYCFLNYSIKEVDGDGLLLLKKRTSSTTFALLKSSATNQPEPAGANNVCARNRWLIKTSIMEHNRSASKMESLNLFALIRSKKLREMPNCPNNGIYSIASYNKNRPKIICTIHGTTETNQD